MALGDLYATVDELKSRLSIDGNNSLYDEELTEALRTSSEEIERFCNRQFNRVEDGEPTARVYPARNRLWTEVDDFHTTTDLVVETDLAGTGTFGSPWATSDYELEPFNGVVNGQPGWPFWRINALGSKEFPACVYAGERRARLRVTAEWGWANVPAPIKQACLLLSAKNFQLKDAPLGVAGMSDFGVVRVQDDRLAQSKLRPYVRSKILVA